ncbi:MAG: DUF4080 domain-containing protein [Lachnospiraceae bacterium]|nr:DUF4080 domain-containing protein [Lachnospiraceae bacterium]
MKVLLTAVNAKYIHSNPGLYSLRAYAKRYEEHIEIAEYTINNLKEEILADIYKRQPDVVAFSCYIWNWEMIQDLCVELHKILRSTDLWLGGPEVSFDAQEIVKQYPFLTGIMLGEGEVTFCELMSHYVDNVMEIGDICGICTTQGYTPPRPLTDLSKIPFLYHTEKTPNRETQNDRLEEGSIYGDLKDFQNRIIYYESSRGCPFRCSYCLSSIDKQVRLRDISIVRKELQFFLDNRVSQVKFVDRTFNCDHVHAMEIWKYLRENDNGVTNFHFEISADIINEEEIALLNTLRPGLVQLEIGVQTTNPKTLEAINRYVKFSHLKTIVEKIHAGKNIHTHLDLIAGLPYEDYDSFVTSFNDVYALHPEQLQLGFLKVLKGSEMHQRAEEYGIVYNSKPPYEILYSKWLSYSNVLRLKKVEEMVELYYNSNQFTATIPVLERAFNSPFHLYQALAEYYEERGYFVSSPARSYRYHVLLQFACSIHSENWEELIGELLTYDMYLRENLKSRPDFALELEPYKEQIRLFYQKEEENRKYLPDYGAYRAKQLSKMTHLEPFHYPVWESDTDVILERRQEPTFVLFDYQNRDALTYQARTERMI